MFRLGQIWAIRTAVSSWPEMPQEPSAAITYLVLVVGFVLTFVAFILTHATFVDGDYNTASPLAIACAVLVLGTFVLSWSRLHWMVRVFSVFLGLVASWSFLMAGAYLLRIRLLW